MTPRARSNIPQILPITGSIWFWGPYVIISDCFQVLTIYNTVYDFSLRFYVRPNTPLTPQKCGWSTPNKKNSNQLGQVQEEEEEQTNLQTSLRHLMKK